MTIVDEASTEGSGFSALVEEASAEEMVEVLVGVDVEVASSVDLFSVKVVAVSTFMAQKSPWQL